MHKGMLWLITVALVGTLMLAAPARAQETNQQGYAVYAGIFLPSKESVRKATEDVWFSVNLTYNFQTSKPTESGYYYDLGAFVGFYGTSDARVIPVGLSFTGYLNEQFFYRATAGIGFASNGDDKTGFDWSLGFGYNFSAGTTPVALFVGYGGFVDGGDDLQGFTVALQFRF